MHDIFSPYTVYLRTNPKEGDTYITHSLDSVRMQVLLLKQLQNYTLFYTTSGFIFTTFPCFALFGILHPQFVSCIVTVLCIDVVFHGINPCYYEALYLR